MFPQTSRKGEVLTAHAKKFTVVLIMLATTVLADEAVLILCMHRPKISTDVQGPKISTAMQRPKNNSAVLIIQTLTEARLI